MRDRSPRPRRPDLRSMLADADLADSIHPTDKMSVAMYLPGGLLGRLVAHIRDLVLEVRRLRVKVAGLDVATTMMRCGGCGDLVRGRDILGTRCARCEVDRLTAERDALIEAKRRARPPGKFVPLAELIEDHHRATGEPRGDDPQ